MAVVPVLLHWDADREGEEEEAKAEGDGRADGQHELLRERPL